MAELPPLLDESALRGTEVRQLVSDIEAYVERRADRLVELTRDLVRIPSENRAPEGSELACQQYIGRVLGDAGWKSRLYTPDTAPGIAAHPLFWPGRHYEGRPNLAAHRKGQGGGRSLILSGHIDTVPAGSEPWTRDPFCGAIEGNRLYGRGANDMKAGVASNLFAILALAELGIELRGDLLFETVVDEEFGGVNGSLAGRLMGYHADAAIISEPSALRICPAQRGGRTTDVTFAAPNMGLLGKAPGVGVVGQLRVFLNALRDFEKVRRDAHPRHPLYSHLEDPVPVTVTRIFTAPWGTSEPTNTPGCCRLQLFWQCMPGETVSDVDKQFDDWFDRLLAVHPDIFPAKPAIGHPIRWLPGSAIAADHLLVDEISDVALNVLGQRPAVQGIEGPCDMYVFHEFGIPAVLWGPGGGNTHNPDEYVDFDSLVSSTKVLLAFICRWCGVAN